MAKARIKRRALDLAMLAGVTLLMLVMPRHVAFVAVAENWAADSRATLFARPSPPHPDIVLLTITEDTLATFPYRFPVDRGFLAGLLDFLGATGARAVGLDILFDQPTEAAKDDAFRAAAQRFPGTLLVGWTDRDTGLTQRQAEFQAHFLSGIGAAYSNTLKDVSDSTIRRIFPGRVDEGGGYRPGFVPALAAAMGAPTTPTEPTSIIFRIGPDAATPPIRTFPAHAARLLPKAWFKDKVVLVGADLPFEDRHRTPLAAGLGRDAGTLPGVMVHAHALAQVLDGLRPPQPNAVVEALLAVALCAAAAGLGTLRVALWQRLGLAALAVVVYWAGNALAFRELALSLPVVAPTMGFGVMMALSGYHAAHQREVETRFIRDAFSRYVAPGLVARLQDNPDQLALGGEKREVTVLFTDIEGFTGISESLDAGQLVGVLNEYLDGMTACVHRHGGMVDKFIGDAVMAIFGAPEAMDDHAARAIACALEMEAFASAFMDTARERGIPFGRTRIGVHTGVAVVGNVGGSRRFDYTAIGDTVNTASRFEGVNKYFGTAICVSESAAAASGAALRPIGRIVVKGRSAPLPAYTPVAPGQEELARRYGDAYALLRAESAEAGAAFARLAADYPDDALIRFQCHRLETGAPTDLIVMKDK